MNYLAHILLSGSDPDMKVGGLLGDFVKGPLRGELPPAIEMGITLHRAIDVATDKHPQFCNLLAKIPPPWRRYGGILLDVHFDHLLAKRWDAFHPEPLEVFCQRFYNQLRVHWQHLPNRARHFCDVAPKVQWLESYGEKDKIPRMLNNVGQRLRKPVPLGEGWHQLMAISQELDDCFTLLMSEHKHQADQFIVQNRTAKSGSNH